MITSGRVEGAVHLHDPSGTVGSTERSVETGTPGAEAVVEADSPVVRQTEFSGLSLPRERVIGCCFLNDCMPAGIFRR